MKRLLLGISSGVFYTLLSIGISLLTAPFFLKVLTREEFGIFYLINNLIIWTGLLNVGLRGSFKLQLATALGKQKDSDRLSSTSFITQCFVALAVSLLGIALSYLIPPIFNLPETSEVRYVFVILSISFSCSLISNNLASILSVYNKDLNVYTTRTILVALQGMFSIALLYIGWGIVGLSISALLGEIFFLLYMFFLVKVKFGYASLNISLFDRKILIDSLSLGKWFLAGFLSQLLIKHTDLLLIENITGINQVSNFIISSKLFLLASTLLLMIIKIVTPQLIRLVQSHAAPDFRIQMTMLFLKFFTGLTIVSGTAIYIFNEIFISWWVGKGFYLGNTINLLLLLAFMFTSFNLAARALLVAQADLKSQKISALAEGILHLSLSFLLGIFYGLQGIVAGMAISSTIACLISIFFLIKHKYFFFKTKKEIALLIFYVLFFLSILITLSIASLFEKKLLTFSLIIIGFIWLLKNDIRFLTTKFLKIG